jgi:hypothetical protein
MSKDFEKIPIVHQEEIPPLAEFRGKLHYMFPKELFPFNSRFPFVICSISKIVFKIF